MSLSLSPARLLVAAISSLAMLVAFAPAAQAEVPAPPFERFAGCISPAEEEPLELEYRFEFCIRSVVTGGHLQAGKQDVPIENPIELTGSLTGAFEHFTANSEGGLDKVKEEVPGGVVGLTGLSWLIKLLPVSALKLYAVTELAGPPSNLDFNHITLPIKVHLVNPVLGNNCYIGSNSEPITLNLTTGTTNPPPPNEPISGEKADEKEEGEVVYFENAVYVDNSFAVPAARGCVLTLLGFIPVSLDSTVNSQAGLPSPAGTNEAVQDINEEIALQESVYP
jgi:hypothetical protein